MAKLADLLGCGPSILDAVGFNIVLYNDCGLFFME